VKGALAACARPDEGRFGSADRLEAKAFCAAIISSGSKRTTLRLIRFASFSPQNMLSVSCAPPLLRVTFLFARRPTDCVALKPLAKIPRQNFLSTLARTFY